MFQKEHSCIFLLYILFPLKMNVVIYNSEYILLPLHKYNNIISLFQMENCHIFSQYIHMYIYLYALLSQNECCNLSFTLCTITLADIFQRKLVQTNHTSKFYFFIYFFIVIEHSIRNKTSNTRNTRSLKYDTKQIQAY